MKTTQRSGFYGFAVLCFIFFFVYLHRVSTAALSPDLMQEFSTTATELGILSSAYFYAYALLQIPSGFLIDSLGPRKMATIFTVLTAVGSLLFGLSQTLLMASVSRFLIGIGVSVIFVSVIKILAEWFRDDEVSSFFGIFILVGNLGAIGAATPLVFVTLKIGWRLTFGVLAIVALVQACLAWVIIKDSPPKTKDLPQPNNPRPKSPLSNRFKAILLDRQVTTVAIIVLAIYGILIAFQGLWGIPYLINLYHMEKTEASFFMTVIAIGVCVGAPLFGILSDKIIKARKPIVIFGAVFYTVIWFPLAFKTANLSKTSLYLICFGMGFFHGCTPVNITLLKESVTEDAVGLATGYMNMFPMGGIAIFQPLIGWILDTTGSGTNSPTNAVGYATAFKFCFVILVIAAIATFTLRETFAKQERSGAYKSNGGT